LRDAVEIGDCLVESSAVRKLDGELQIVRRGEQGAIEVRDERARLLDLRVLAEESAGGVRIVPEGRGSDFMG
jgi:hypothetical protein